MADGKYLFFDTENKGAGKEYEMTPEAHFTLGQWAWDNGPVYTTTDYHEFMEIVRSAPYLVGHNILSADLPWLFGADSFEPLRLAQEHRVLDTLILASLLTPAPWSYRDSKGHLYTKADKPGPAFHYLALDNLCFQFGLEGKLGDLKVLAKKYNPPKTKIADLDFGLIPADDPDFLAYAEQDVVAVRSLWEYQRNLISSQNYKGEYIWRELYLAAITSRISRNGLKVDVGVAQERVDALAAEKDKWLTWLQDNYDFPKEGKAPWSTNAGKDIIFKVLADAGITAESHPEWEKTDTGNLSLGGQAVIALCEGTPLEEFAEALAALKGQRSLAQLALDSMYPDGKVHPSVMPLQRSGRWSVTKPGLTVTGNNDDEDAGIIRTADKEYYIADEGHLLVELDYSAADARAMGALSGDPEFNRRFEKDENGEDLYDPHNLSGEAIFGADVYYGDGPRDKKARPTLRTAAKPYAHGKNYNMGAFKSAHTLNKVALKEGLDLHFWAPKHENSKSPLPEIERRPDSIDTRTMDKRFNEQYPWLKRFKERAVEQAEKLGYVENSWGRRMPVSKGREWTQAPALWGQSTTREMMGDALIRLVDTDIERARWLKLIVHDALVVEVPEKTAEQDAEIVRECMESVFDPGTKVSTPLDFPVGVGHPAKSWRDASHI